MSDTALVEKYREQFLAAVCLNLANSGTPDMMNQFIAQMIASSVMSGDPSAVGMIDAIQAVVEMTRALVEDPQDIWPELMPGPVRDDQHHDYLMFKIGSMMTENVELDLKGKVRYRDMVVDRVHQPEQRSDRLEVYGQDLDGNDVWILLHGTQTMTKVIDRALAPGDYPNIKLDYRLVLHRNIDGEGESYFANGAEFFVDEHGLQWVKFVAENGYHRGKEHMWRTDCEGFMVTKA